MNTDLIKTPVTVTDADNDGALWIMKDADGQTVLVTGNRETVERIANTLNVLSGLLSGDPSGTATWEERELWRASAIRWNKKVEDKLSDCLDALRLAQSGASLLRSQCTDGTDVADVLDSFLPEVKDAIDSSRSLLQTGKETTHTKPPKPAGNA